MQCVKGKKWFERDPGPIKYGSQRKTRLEGRRGSKPAPAVNKSFFCSQKRNLRLICRYIVHCAGKKEVKKCYKSSGFLLPLFIGLVTLNINLSLGNLQSQAES